MRYENFQEAQRLVGDLAKAKEALAGFQSAPRNGHDACTVEVLSVREYVHPDAPEYKELQAVMVRLMERRIDDLKAELCTLGVEFGQDGHGRG
jgi:hypothetical protein